MTHWTFNVGDLIEKRNPSYEPAKKHYEIEDCLTNLDGERFYHVDVRAKSYNGWGGGLNTLVLPANEVEEKYIYAEE